MKYVYNVCTIKINLPFLYFCLLNIQKSKTNFHPRNSDVHILYNALTHIHTTHSYIFVKVLDMQSLFDENLFFSFSFMYIFHFIQQKLYKN